MAQGIEGRGSAVKKEGKDVHWGPTDNEPEAAGGHGLKEWGQGKPLFGAGGLTPAKGKLLEGIQKGREDLQGKTGMGRSHVERRKGDQNLKGDDAGGATRIGGEPLGEPLGESQKGDLEVEKKGGVARSDTEKEGIGGRIGRESDGKVRRDGADA